MHKVIIVEDNSMFRKSIGSLLEKEEVAEVLCDAPNGKEFLELIDKHNPDVVLMDISMPVMDGVEATKLALKKNPSLSVLALSSFGDETYYYKMVDAGVKGFVLKDANVEELKQAIRVVADGGSWFSGDLLKKVITSIANSRNKVCDLTDREQQILCLICEGLTNEQIGERLCISYDTVRWHRSNMLSKTGCTNTAALVMFAIKNKIVQI